jgi:phospholipid-binding lipoprotein MlaA
MRRSSLAALLLASALVGGCATTGAPAGTPAGGPGAGATAAAPVRGQDPSDPWERWNRSVYAFNDAIDTAALRPVAETYVKVVPSPIRTAIGNFFGNFGDAWSAVNHVLQGKPEGAIASLARFGTNTVFGLGGLIDIAGEAGIERQSEDLGQTLGRWGVPPGPYMVLPFFGPSTVRDTVTFVPDRYVSPAALTRNTAAEWGLRAVDIVDTRATLLPATRMLGRIALDPYVFSRDAHLQRRRNQVYDGEPPEERYDLEPDAPAQPPAAPDPAGGRMKVPGQPSPPAAR